MLISENVFPLLVCFHCFDDNDVTSSWALIRRGTTGRVQTAPEGTQVHLECSAVTSDPEVKVEWMLPDLSTVEEATDKVEISERGQLVISNASVSDSGLYHCIVRSKTAVDLMPLRLTVKERSLSPTALNGQKIMLEMGNSLSLPCEVTSAQPSQTLWYLPKNQVLLPTQKTRRAEVLENGTLVVRKMTQEDAGEYSCLASNLYGVDMVVDDGTLILKKVTLADEGKYACVARNSAGDDIKNMIVEAELQEPYINGVRGKTTAKLLAVSYQTALLDSLLFWEIYQQVKLYYVSKQFPSSIYNHFAFVFNFAAKPYSKQACSDGEQTLPLT
uniref:Ig-like domain-containing protein n=1 Tax=Poecilia mexicana TaxID=48701 RepID=A0A3B3WIB4_9TELE